MIRCHHDGHTLRCTFYLLQLGFPLLLYPHYFKMPSRRLEHVTTTHFLVYQKNSICFSGRRNIGLKIEMTFEIVANNDQNLQQVLGPRTLMLW